jgi:CubicO group peptidase (beta-lactamase class C family)
MRRPGLLLGSILLSAGFWACSFPEPFAQDDPASSATVQGLHDGSAEAEGARCSNRDIPPRYRAFARAFDAERQALGAPGAAVAILEHGRVTFAHGFGTKGPNSTTPVQATTLFRIGSMTKALTATAVLSLVDEHELRLDARLKDLVPDIAIDGPEIERLTVRQLLSHQSGLFDYGEIDGFYDDAALSSFSTSDEFRAGEYFMAPPGAFWNYSNPNFVLAGLAAERVEKTYYRALMAKRVLEPLSMRRTFFLPSEVLADGDYAAGKSTDQNGNPWDVRPDSYESSWMRPAGLAYSSVLDYASFVRSLYSGKPRVLSSRLRAEMQRIQVPTLNFGAEQGYGLGVFVSEGFQLEGAFYPTVMVSHGGDISGYAADFYLLPESGFGIVMLADADGAHFKSSLALAMRSFGKLPEPTGFPPDVAVDPSTFASLAGTYVDPHLLGPAIVTVTGDAPQISLPGFDAAGIEYDPVLTPISADNFLVTTAAYGPQPVTFVRDASGAYTWIRTRLAVFTRQQAASTLTATRVDAVRVHERLRRHAAGPEPRL